MSSEPIRVGIIGAGANTRDRHIPGLQAHRGGGACQRLQPQPGIERAGGATVRHPTDL